MIAFLATAFAASIPDLATDITRRLAVPQGTTVIVADFRDLNGDADPSASWLADELTSELARQGKVSVLDRSQAAAVESEVLRQRDRANYDATEVASEHKKWGADYLLVGTYVDLPGDDRVYVRAIKVETGQVVSAVAGWVSDKDGSTTPSPSANDFWQMVDNLAMFHFGGGAEGPSGVRPIGLVAVSFGFDRWYGAGAEVRADYDRSVGAEVMGYFDVGIGCRGFRPFGGVGGHTGHYGIGLDYVGGFDVRIARGEKNGLWALGVLADAASDGGLWRSVVELRLGFGTQWNNVPKTGK